MPKDSVKPLQVGIDPDDGENNPSANPSLSDLMTARLHRRHLLKGGIGAIAGAALGSLSVVACGGGDDAAAPAAPTEATPASTPSPRIWPIRSWCPRAIPPPSSTRPATRSIRR